MFRFEILEFLDFWNSWIFSNIWIFGILGIFGFWNFWIFLNFGTLELGDGVFSLDFLEFGLV